MRIAPLSGRVIIAHLILFSVVVKLNEEEKFKQYIGAVFIEIHLDSVAIHINTLKNDVILCASPVA